MSLVQVLIVAGSEEAGRIEVQIGRGGPGMAAQRCDGVDAAAERLRQAFFEAIVLGPPYAGEGALAAIRELRRVAPDSAIIVVAAHADEAFRAAARASGAADCFAVDQVDAPGVPRALHDAVERRQLESGMRRHEAQLRMLFDLNPHPMWVYDARSLAFLAVNRIATRSYGYSEDEFRSMTVADLCVPDEAARLRACAAAGLPAPLPEGLVRHVDRSGARIEVEISTQAVPLWGAHARLVQARNVTAERRAIRAIETSERRFRDLFEYSAGYICIHSLAGVLLAVNPAAAASLGRSVAELVGTSLQELIGPALRSECEAYLRRVARRGEDEGLLRVRSSGGERLWQYRNRLFTDFDGVTRVMGYAQDITALRAAERERELSEHRLRTIADALPLMIVYVGADQRVAFANDAYRRLRRDAGEVVGRHLREVLGEERYRQRLPYLARAISGERVVFHFEEGEGEDARSIEATLIPECAQAGAEVLGVHAMMQDVTAHKREERRLLHLARVDPLTGLLNRTGFHERLDNAIARARDQGSLLALLYLDVDHFKQVNDTYGHAAGDALLRAFATRLGEKVRGSDVIARLGGDEFTVLIEALSDVRHAERVAGKLVAAMRRPFELPGDAPTVSVGVSIGICLCRGGLLAANEMLLHADTLLYAAKQAGRGTFRKAMVPAVAKADRGTG
jgi:diguanylate cyclase (GGDEF)-like protein/PAS domain S-box-containing protein